MRPAPEGRFDRRLLAPMMLGSILNPINSSILAVALVPIGVAFGAPASQTAWLVSALYLATAIGQPLTGRLIDLFGPRPLFLAGAALTAVAGLLGTVAPVLGVLVAARVILGFGTCAGYPASMNLIRREADRTGQASPAGVLSALSIATQTIAVIGPTLGGLLIGVGGWRATFAVDVPLGVAAFVLGWIVLPRGGERVGGRRDLDPAGILLFAATLVALLLFFMELRQQLWWLLAVALVAGAGFALRELRAREPFLDVRVFAGNVPLLLTFARAVLAATVSYCFLYGVTQWLESGRGLDPTTTGLILLPTFALGILVVAVTGRRPEIRAKLMVGAVLQLVAAILVLVMPDAAPIWLLILLAVVFGIPQGVVNLAIQNSVFHQSDPLRSGASAGLQRTFMYVGAMAAGAASGAVFHDTAGTAQLHVLGVVMVVASGLFVGITVLDRSLRRVDRAARGV